MSQGYTVFSIPVGLVYRPNEAKVKNLKSKDYLGKARLVAASDRANAFTGFAGVERLKAEAFGNMGSAAKDDRPEEKLSYAATHLVKPGLSSRTRQQSEPPINRNVFPPTPPPEADRPASSKAASESAASGTTAAGTTAPVPGNMSRAESVRGGGPKPRPIDTRRASFERGDDKIPQRPGTLRSASERPRPRGDLPSYSGRRDSAGRRYSRDRDVGRPRKYSDEMDEDEGADELYDIYEDSRSPNTMRRMKSRAQRQRSIEEEDEDDYEDDFDEGDFEMVSRSKTRRGSQPTRAPTRAYSRRVEVKRIRVKVHAEDTRFVNVGTAVEFADLVDQIRSKFGVREDFKVMMKDDDDFITMADQDDLEMALDNAKAAARKEGSDTGKMEVSLEMPLTLFFSLFCPSPLNSAFLICIYAGLDRNGLASSFASTELRRFIITILDYRFYLMNVFTFRCVLNMNMRSRSSIFSVSHAPCRMFLDSNLILFFISIIFTFLFPYSTSFFLFVV